MTNLEKKDNQIDVHQETSFQEEREETVGRIFYNLLWYPEELTSEYPKLKELNWRLTWVEEDENTVIQTIRSKIRGLRHTVEKTIQEKGIAKLELVKFENTIKDINDLIKEIESLNNPDFKEFLEWEKAKLIEINDMINEWIAEENKRFQIL